MDNSEYLRRIHAAYDGETRGEAFFRALADQPDLAPLREALLVLAVLEIETRARMAPLMERLGLDTRHSAEARNAGLERARHWAGVGPEAAIAKLQALIDPFVESYDALAEAATPEDAAVLAYVAAHERALSAFARNVQGRDPVAALGPVLALLSRPAEPRPLN